jgi:hypothetical protein
MTEPLIDRTHNDAGFKVRAIIDNALADLFQLGCNSRDAAATMMACQAIARIKDNEERRSVAQFAAELVWDIDDTDDGKVSE